MSLLDLNADLDLTLDVAAPIDAAATANANVAAPIDAAAAANVLSFDSEAAALADQDSLIMQSLDGEATGDRDPGGAGGQGRARRHRAPRRTADHVLVDVELVDERDRGHHVVVLHDHGARGVDDHHHRSSVRRIVPAVALLFAAACSGGGDDSTLGRAERAMAELDAGTMLVELATTAEGVEAPVGFRVEGAFSLESDGELPVFDFDHTELLASEQIVTKIVSDGEQVAVDVDGEVRVLGEEQASALRLGDDEGFADLGIASWVDEPKESTRGDQTIVRGRVDAADLLSDLARISAQVGGVPVGDIDAGVARDLAERVRSSEIEVVIGEEDLPRSVDATIDFGADVPTDLVDVLGPYAGARLALRVELAPLEEELSVRLPT